MTPRLFLCLGPHRTGTSLITAGLAALGAVVPHDPDLRNDDNAKGFFEPPEVVALNDRLLAASGASWDTPAFDGTSATDPDPDPDLAAEARGLVTRLLRPHPLAALKDPRLCLLMPFWRAALSGAGYAPGDILRVHCLRSPLEAAQSQAARARREPAQYPFGHTLSEGVALWLSYTGQAMRDAAGAAGPQIMLEHGAMMADPRRELRRVAELAGLAPDPGALDSFARDFVDGALHRSHDDPALWDGLDPDLAPARELWQALRDQATRPALDAGVAAGVADTVDALRRAGVFDRIAGRGLGRASATLAQARAVATLAQAQRTEADTARDAYAAQIAPLADELARARTALDAAVAERETLRRELETQTATLAATVTEREALRQELETQTATLGAVAQDRETILAELTKTQETLATLVAQRDGKRWFSSK